MPLYEYQCSACGNVTEELRSIDNRDDRLVCKKCGSPLKRNLSLFNKSTAKKGIANAPADNNKPVETKSKPSAIRIGSGCKGVVSNCVFKNVDTGIRVEPNASLNSDANIFSNVVKPIEILPKK